MKHIKLFEEWSPNFNRTLQGAYGKAQSTNKGFGKATKAIIDRLTHHCKIIETGNKSFRGGK